MSILGTLIASIVEIAAMVITLYTWVIIIAALITWVRPDPYNPIVQTLYRLTEPVYAKLRGFMPTVIGGVDMAPIIVLLILKFIELFILRILMQAAGSL